MAKFSINSKASHCVNAVGPMEQMSSYRILTIKKMVHYICVYWVAVAGNFSAADFY